MRHRIHVFGTLGTTLIVAATSAHAQAGVGAPFGARDPRHCTVHAPKGAPSAEQAVQAFVCAREVFEDTNGGGTLRLMDQVTVQVGRGRRFQMSTDAMSDIDPSATVYPIRGSYVSYSCSTRAYIRDISAGTRDANKNCTSSTESNALGFCYTTTFGDLHCQMGGNGPMQFTHDVPPPRS